jgi:nitrite reductase/ring-hydroxylating ferredoxin subunit
MNKQMMTEKETAEPVTRRKFFNRLWALFGLAAIAEFIWLGLSFLNSRKERNQPAKKTSIITAGPMENFRRETVTAIPSGRFYLACLSDGSFLALSRTCTHLGCAVPWDAETHKFVCPCHGSTFSLTGEVLTSPAPRPLDTYPVRLENGIVKVDISSPRKRERFDPSQATRI